jgi:hypothetical protein
MSSRRYLRKLLRGAKFASAGQFKIKFHRRQMLQSSQRSFDSAELFASEGLGCAQDDRLLRVAVYGFHRERR